MSDLSRVETERLQDLVPLFSLTSERLKELSALSTMERVAAGVNLFHEGDVDNQSIYLLKGEVRLQDSGGKRNECVSAGSAEARHPLGDQQPRQLSALALTDVVVLRVDNNVLDYMITWDQMALLEGGSGRGHGATLAEPPEWMNKLQSSLPLRNIPAPNLERLLDRMERVEVRSGDVVVQQGEPGDYYYVLDQGRAKVTRQVELAELEEGASFGEEALIAESPRNATVTMDSDGVVFRLSKRDFDELLKQPLLNWVSAADAREQVNTGARWLDVRHAREFNHYRLPNALNLPLHELRQRMDELDRGVAYVCYCKTGRRSSAAAFLLSQSGFNVSVLRGGLQVLPSLLRT